MRIYCDIDEDLLPGDYANVEGVTATCSRCGHTTESYGTSDASISRCLVLLRDECPREENNFYVERP